MEENIKAIQKIHLALVAGVTAFCVIAIFLNQSQGAFMEKDQQLLNILCIASIAVATVSVISSFVVFRKIVSGLKEISDMELKFTRLRSAWFVQAALVEGPLLFGIIVFLLTGNYYLFILIGILLVIMISLRPGMEQMKKYLEPRIGN